MAKDQLMELVDAWKKHVRSSEKCAKNITTDAITFVNAAISTNMDVRYISEDTIMKLYRILNTDVLLEKWQHTKNY